MSNLGSAPVGISSMIPLLEVSGKLQVETSRNPKSYPINSYTRQIVAKGSPRGSYLRLNPIDGIRLQQPAEWPYGTPRPRSTSSTVSWTPREFNCVRYAPDPIQLDQLSVDVANWDIQGVHARALARKAMINRTNRTMDVVTVPGNYGSTATCTALAGGFADQGTVADPILLRLFQAAFLRIYNASGGSVSPDEVGMLINHETAIRLSRSREIREFVATSPASLDIVVGEERYNSAKKYFLPAYYSHFRFDVEDTIFALPPGNQATEAAPTRSFPDNAALFYVRQGPLNKSDSEQEFSTITQFIYEDMTVEALTSQWDRLLLMSVVDHFDVAITAPQCGVWVPNLFS